MKFVMLVPRKQDPEKFGLKKIREYGRLDIVNKGFIEASGEIVILEGNSLQIRKMLEEYKTIWICDGPIQAEHYVTVSIDDMKEEGS